jgi:hypothetical protein
VPEHHVFGPQGPGEERWRRSCRRFARGLRCLALVFVPCTLDAIGVGDQGEWLSSRRKVETSLTRHRSRWGLVDA